MPTNASAKNDTLNATEDRSVTIDVTDNDTGSGVKLYSLDQTTPGHVSASGLSAMGATIRIQNGQVVYSASSDAITALAAGQHATDTFTYTIQGSSGTLSTATVTINLTGVNDAPAVVGAVTAQVNEDAGVSTLNALANASDPDAGSTLSVVSVPSSLPTGVTYDAATHSFKLDPTNAIFQSLGAGDTRTVSVNYQVSDGTLKTSDTATWTVHGVNDTPTIGGVHTGTVVEGSLFQLGAAGYLTISDPDAGESHFAASTLQFGNYGAFAFDANTGVWGYLVNNAKIQFLGAGDTVTDTLTVKSADGSTSQDIVININGVNDAATMSGVKTGAVTEGSTTAHVATGVLTVADADQNQAKLAIPANLAGTYGTFAIDQATGKWTYTLDDTKAAPLKAGQTTTDTLTVKSVDGTASSQIVVTITGTDTAPTVSGAVKGNVAGNAPASLDALGNATDSEGGHLNVVNVPTNLPPGVTYDAATHSFILDPTNPTYKALAQGETQTVTVSYGVSDGVNTSPAQVSWTITGSNDAPVVAGAVTGAATQGGLSTVNALGTASDVDHNTTLTVTGVPGALPAGVTYDPATHSFTLNSADPSYKALAQGETQTVTVTYAVSDGLTTTPATVSWTVTGANDAPVVSAPLTGAAAQGATSSAVDALGGASDVDHNTTLTVTGVPASLPAGVTYDAATHSFSLNAADPSYAHLGAGQTQAVSVSFAVSDGLTTTPQTVTWTVTGANDAPVVAGALSGAAAQGGVSTVAALTGASDVDDGTTLTVVQPASLPAGVTYDAATHSYSLNAADPSYAHLAAGATQVVTVSYGVSDGAATTQQSISWTVTGANDAPTVSAPLVGAAADGAAPATINALAGAADVDDGAQLSVVNVPSTLPAGVTYDAATHSFSLDGSNAAYDHLAAGQTQAVSVTFGVSDGAAVTQQTVTWTVTGANDAPVVSAPLTAAAADGAAPAAVDALAGASDVDDGSQLSVVQPATLPAGVTYDAASHSFVLDGSNAAYDHLAAGQTQAVTLTYGVSDGTATTQQTITWTVTGANDAPVVSAPLTAAAADGAAPSAVNALAGASDVDDGSTLSVVVPATLPAGVTYDAATHSYSLNAADPSYAHLAAGDTQQVSLTFGVSDGTAVTPQTVTWTVTGANDAPVVAGALTGAAADGAAPAVVDALGGASDVDDHSTLSVVNVPASLPAGVTYDPATHSFSLDGSNAAYDHLAAGQTQAVSVTFGVSDGAATVAQSITWTVTGANDAPTVSAPLVGATGEGATASLNALAGASDVDDGSSLSVVLPNTLPAGVTYDTATHSLSLDASNGAYEHLAAGQTQTVTLTYGVTDGTATTAQTATWTVTGVNDAAHISGQAVGGVTEDSATLHTASGVVTVADLDDGQAVFAQPSSLAGTYGAFSFDAATGQWGYTLDDSKVQALAGGQTTSDTLHVTSLDGTAGQDIVVTITGTNDVATITPDGATQAVEDSTTFTAGGHLNITDADAGQAQLASYATVQGAYGSMQFNPGVPNHPAWIYTLNNSNPQVQALAAGETMTDTVHVTSLDGSAGYDIKVIINGANDVATITGQSTGGVTEDSSSLHTASGVLTVADVDHGQAKFATPASLTGADGVFTFNTDTGAWGYTLDDSKVQALGVGQTTTDTLHVTSLDGTASQDIVVTINGTNDVATITGEVGTQVTEDGQYQMASAHLTVTDADAGQAQLASMAPIAGQYGSFQFNPNDPSHPVWIYTLDNSKVQALAEGETTTDTVHVTSLDGTAGYDISVVIHGSNDVATISGQATGAVTEDSTTLHTASGQLTVADVDHGQASFATPASLLGADGVFAFNAATGAWSYTLDDSKVQALAAGETTSDVLHVTSLDGTAGQDIVVTVTGANDAPVTNAIVAGAVEGGATSTIDALAGATDVDQGAVLSVVNVPALPTGVTYSAATHSFTLDPTNAVFNQLSQGQVQTVTVNYGVSDGTATTADHVSWQVTGVNDASVIAPGGDYTGAILEADRGTAQTASITPLIAEVEPNNTLATAQSIDLSLLRVAPNSNLYDLTVPAVAINGAISATTDADYYKLHLNAGQFLTLDIDTPSSSALDSYIFLYNSAGTLITSDDDSVLSQGGGGSTKAQDSFLQFTVPTTGDYYLMVKDFDQQGQSSVGAYVLNVSVNDQSLPLTDTGSFNFTDDIQDTHAVAVAANGTGYVGALTAVVNNDTLGDGTGQVTWTFSVPASQTQFLAAGQAVTQSYTLSLTDSAGDVQTRPVTVTLTGVNDAPAIVSSTGDAIVHLGAGSVPTQVTSGSFTFVDADLNDTHTLSVVGAPSNFSAYVIQDSTGTGTGTVYWQLVGFSGSSARVDMTVADNHNASSTQEIVFSTDTAALPALGGNDTLIATTAINTLTGGLGNDVFVFAKGTANGDHITDFDGHLSAPGDTLQFSGYGAGATFTQIDATHWQINYTNAGVLTHEVITFDNGAQITTGDFSFI